MPSLKIWIHGITVGSMYFAGMPSGLMMRMTGSGVAQVIYTGKNSRVKEQFTALDWLARLVTHIPGKGEQLVLLWLLFKQIPWNEEERK